jgi:glutamine synthetase
MFKTLQEAMQYVKEHKVQFVDFKVIDLAGRWHHLTVPAARFDDHTMRNGIGFDGSSYGFKTVEKSDMVFIPDLTTAFIDPFTKEKTLVFVSNVFNLTGGLHRYESDPRFIANKAEQYMKDTGIADKSMFGPEFEFYILDHFSYHLSPHYTCIDLDSDQAEWNSGHNETKNSGYKVRHHGGYHVDLPLDVNYDLRNAMVQQLEALDVPVKYHHPEVGGPGQLEIELMLDSSNIMADRTMKLKYVLKNMAVAAGKTVTFMPKPFYKEAGNGMHVHMHLFKEGVPLFYDENGYSGMSQMALYAIGGVLKHAAALMGITNPSTNSYKRLVPGYEAPVSICFATANRSAVIRIPGYANEPNDKRFEFRPSDATSNPYLCYAALLMAMLDGIKNQIDPTAEGFGPWDVNVFDLSPEDKAKIKGLPTSLFEAADALEADHEFLLEGGVFTKDAIANILKLIRKDAAEVSTIPHPKEYELYFDL